MCAGYLLRRRQGKKNKKRGHKNEEEQQEQDEQEQKGEELQKRFEEAEDRKAKKDKIFKTENTFYRNIVCRVY